jgi:hypothetical protein
MQWKYPEKPLQTSTSKKTVSCLGCSIERTQESSKPKADRILQFKTPAPFGTYESLAGRSAVTAEPSSSNPAAKDPDHSEDADWAILREPEVYDEDEGTNSTAAAKQNPMLRYFHKRSPEWWAAYRRQMQRAKDAPLPTDYDI